MSKTSQKPKKPYFPSLFEKKSHGSLFFQNQDFSQKIQHKSGLSCQIKPVDGGNFRGESALSFYVHLIIAKFSAPCLKNGIK